MMTAVISSHFLSFYRLVGQTGWIKASCSCGWSAEGKPAEVYGKAAGHDLEPLHGPVAKTSDFESENSGSNPDAAAIKNRLLDDAFNIMKANKDLFAKSLNTPNRKWFNLK